MTRKQLSSPLIFMFCALVGCNCKGSNNNQTPDIAGADMNSLKDMVIPKVSSADFYTPAVVADILSTERAVTWSLLQSPASNLMRFSMGPAESQDVLAVQDTQESVSASLTTEIGLAGQARTTTETLLRAMFQWVEVDGGLRIMSVKHPMYALDGQGSAVVLTDIRSIARASGAGYLVFSITSQSDGYTLKATARHVWNEASSGFILDTTWQSRDITYAEGTLALGDTASTLVLRDAPINFEMPKDFNPSAIGRVSNPEFLARDPGPNVLDTLSLSQTYAPQISARGNDPQTAAQATSMLAAIQRDLVAQGASLRYPISFYTLLREGMLKRTLVSADSFNGQLGQRSVPFVYFTNETDDTGKHHPFMVVATYGLPDSLSLLWDIPRPPGDGRGGGYPNESVTRIAVAESYLIKIPLRDYGNVSSLTENVMQGSLADDEGVTRYDHHNYASVSATGVAIDGVVVYPSYNNRLQYAQADAELSTQGMHAGRGLDAHYHSDAHSAAGNGLHLYNDSDYIGHTHPPIISIGFDGIAGYGIYKQDEQAQDGQDVPLDEYAGHQHGDYGYHYHSVSATETTRDGTTYTTHMFPPRGAWAGKINDIPDFWDNNRPDYSNEGANTWVGK